MSYPLNKKAIVIKNIYEHEFKIGETVEIVMVDELDPELPYSCSSPNCMENFWLSPQEIEIIND